MRFIGGLPTHALRTGGVQRNRIRQVAVTLQIGTVLFDSRPSGVYVITKRVRHAQYNGHLGASREGPEVAESDGWAMLPQSCRWQIGPKLEWQLTGAKANSPFRPLTVTVQSALALPYR